MRLAAGRRPSRRRRPTALWHNSRCARSTRCRTGGADPSVAAVARARAPPALDLWALLSYLALAVVVLIQLWLDPNGRVLASNDDDHGFFLFVMAHGERVLFHGANPFFSRPDERAGRRQHDGQHLGAGAERAVAPVTHFFGPGVSVVLLLTLGLAGTAAAWYWVLSRHLVRSRLAAWLGGLWCGFCPAMVSHANGHINFVTQFVVPFIVWQVLRLREPGRVVRGGVILGLLIVLQVFINEEILLFTALALASSFPYAAMARRRRGGRGGSWPGWRSPGRCRALLAYPLWLQFTGPGSYHGQPFLPDKYVTDLLSIGAYARQSLAGNGVIARALSVSPTEDNTFFGLPLAGDARDLRGRCCGARWPPGPSRSPGWCCWSFDGPAAAGGGHVTASRCRSGWSATCRSSIW